MAQFVRVGKRLMNLDHIMGAEITKPGDPSGAGRVIRVDWNDSAHEYITDPEQVKALEQSLSPAGQEHPASEMQRRLEE